LAAVAASDGVTSGKWARIKPALTQVGDRLTTDAALWFVRPDGSYYTVRNGLETANLSDRGYFPRLMAGQQVWGDLVVSKSTGRMSSIIAVPIRVGQNVVGGLGASIDMVEVAKQVDKAMALPPNMVFYALDSQGRTALHIDRANIFDFPGEVGSPSLRGAVQKMLDSQRGSVTYTFKGAKRTVIFMKSEPTGWIFAIGTVRT
jgi:hypothetical protein